MRIRQTGQTRAPAFAFYFASLPGALPLADVEEVVPLALLSTPPGVPVLLGGFLNLRGALVPVVRMESALWPSAGTTESGEAAAYFAETAGR